MVLGVCALRKRRNKICYFIETRQDIFRRRCLQTEDATVHAGGRQGRDGIGIARRAEGRDRKGGVAP